MACLLPNLKWGNAPAGDPVIFGPRAAPEGCTGIMRRRLAVIAALSAVLAAVLCGASFARGKQTQAAGEPGAEGAKDPVFVFKHFERAWREGDAQALSSFASDSPIFIELRGSEQRGGYFTKAQLLYIMKDLFGNTSQLGFEFVRYHNIEKQDMRVYGIAKRSYRVKHSGGLFRDKVYVTLVREGSRWAVAEIKSTW